MNEYAKRVHSIVKDAPISETQQEFIINLIDDLAQSNDSEQLLQLYGSPENFVEKHQREEKQINESPSTVDATTAEIKQKQNNVPRNPLLSKIIKVLYYILLRIPFIVIRVLATILILWITFIIATSPLTSIATILAAVVIILATLSFFIALNAVMTNTYRLLINFIQFNNYESRRLYKIVIWAILTFVAFIIFNIGVHGFISSISLSALTDRFNHITNFVTSFIN